MSPGFYIKQSTILHLLKLPAFLPNQYSLQITKILKAAPQTLPSCLFSFLSLLSF